jgi:hypothetical protein
MLISLQHKVAFAHYPKTAGTSLAQWFRETCPDATYLNPANPHLSVGESLRLLRQQLARSPAGRLRDVGARTARRIGLRSSAWPDSSWRIFGVLRDPFELMISLYEYWRTYPFEPGPRQPLIECAIRHTFRDFVAASVIGKAIAPYEVFFDSGGPLWHRTTLLHFSSLQEGVARMCSDTGLPSTCSLPFMNRTPDLGRDMRRYSEEIGSLMDDLKQHFSWYYRQSPPRHLPHP